MSETTADFVSPVKASLYRLLVDPIEIQTTYEGSDIELPDSVIQAQEYLRYIGQVIDIGELAFSNASFKDLDGNYVRPCKVGDWIVYGRHTGVDIFVEDGDKVRRLRMINDDQVLGVATDIDRIKIPIQ